MGMSEELSEMNGHKTFLALSPAAELQIVVKDAISHILKKLNEDCIYISLNKPADQVEQYLEENGIPAERVRIIDCATGRIARGSKKPNIVYVSRPYNLTDISIHVAKFAKSVKNNGFVIVDSLDIIRMYTKPEVLLRFIHSLSSLPVKYGIKLIVFGSAETFRTDMSTFSQYFDKVSQVSPVVLKKVRPVRVS